MNETIKILNNRLEKNESEKHLILDALQDQWNKVFDDMQLIKDAISRLETSNNFAWNMQSDIIMITDFDFEPFRQDDSMYYLDNYLAYQGYFCDFDNNTLYMVTFGIVVNDRGEIYDSESQKWILQDKDFENNDELYQAIEDYMQSQGVFSRVFTQDYYGNLTQVDMACYIKN